MTVIGREQKWLAGISYLFWPFSLLIIATSLKKDQFLRYHGYQALFLGICITVIYFVVGGFIHIVPYFGAIGFRIFSIFWAVVLGFLMYRCLQGDYFKIPLIYYLAQSNME